eukprot:m51a1_g856 hypothetical protein (147) ;mRNA; r:796016-796624
MAAPGKAAAVFAVVGVDIVLNSALEPAPGGLAGALLLSVCAVVVLFYLMLAATFFFKAGLYSELARRFKVLLGLLVAAFISTLVARFFRVILLIQKNPLPLVWAAPGYFALYIIHRLVLHAYYVVVLHSMYRLSDPSLYALGSSPH